MNIAVIPARGGSKRIPRKNIKQFHGKPMIAWSIDVAKSSGLFDRIIVSTDDEQIAEIAMKWGAEVPFLRPEELSNDHIGTAPVVAHALDWVVQQGNAVKAACCIYATAPFIKIEDLREGLSILNTTKASFVLSATNYASPIFRSFRRNPNGGVQMLFPDFYKSRSQDLPEALHDAAQFYWGKASSWLEGHHGLGQQTRVIMIPRWRVQDIDDNDDWERAELLAPMILGKSKVITK